MSWENGTSMLRKYDHSGVENEKPSAMLPQAGATKKLGESGASFAFCVPHSISIHNKGRIMVPRY